MIDGFIPAQPERDSKLSDFQKAFTTVFAILRTEKSFRVAQLNAQVDAGKRHYWQGRVDEAQAAVDALVRMKDIGKMALLESKLSVVEEWAQQPLLDGAASDPKSLGY